MAYEVDMPAARFNLDGVLQDYHVGGLRYRPGPSVAVQEHIRYAQSKTKNPLLVA